jgi:hypothetical protein
MVKPEYNIKGRISLLPKGTFRGILSPPLTTLRVDGKKRGA